MKHLYLFLVFNLIIISSFSTMAQSSRVLQRAIGLPESADPQIIFSAVDKNVCWGCNTTNSQFIRTIDGGKNWTVSPVPSDSGLVCSCIAAIDSAIAWVVMNGGMHIGTPRNTEIHGGIFKTSDGGLTWEKYADAYKNSGSFPTSIYFFDSKNGVCVGDTSGGNWEIYTTSDGGTNWTRIPSVNIPQPVSGEAAVPYFELSGADNSLWFRTTKGSLYRTSDRGMTWAATRNALGYPVSFNFSFKDSLNGLASYIENGNELFRTTDGGVTWSQIPKPSSLTGLSLFTLTYEKGTSGTYFITSSYNYNYRPIFSTTPGSAYTTDDGSTWIKIDTLPVGQIDFAPDGTGWAGGVNDSIYKWIKVTKSQEISYGDSVSLWGGTIKSWVKTDPSNNPEIVGFTFNEDILKNLPAQKVSTNSLDFPKNGSDTLFNHMQFFWLPQGIAAAPGTYDIPQIDDHIFIISNQEQQAITGTSDPVQVDLQFVPPGYKSTEIFFPQAGTHWIDTTGPEFHGEVFTKALVYGYFKGEITFYDLAVSKAYLESHPHFTGSIKQPEKFHRKGHYPTAYKIDYDSVNHAFNYELTDFVLQKAVTGVEDSKGKNIPERFVLYQNYPNPFNPSTTLKYSIPKESFVTLKVYDVLGREVTTLVNKEQTAGIYEIKYNATNLTSGVYFYRITATPARGQASNTVSTKKLILMK